MLPEKHTGVTARPLHELAIRFGGLVAVCAIGWERKAQTESWGGFATTSVEWCRVMNDSLGWICLSTAVNVVCGFPDVFIACKVCWWSTESHLHAQEGSWPSWTGWIVNAAPHWNVSSSWVEVDLVCNGPEYGSVLRGWKELKVGPGGIGRQEWR